MDTRNWAITGLRQVLTDQAQSIGGKDLFCAQDVADKLAGSLPAREPAPAWDVMNFHDPVAALLAVNIIVTPDSPPGTFRLVRHADDRRMTCKVIDGTVTHEDCRVVAEGVIR